MDVPGPGIIAQRISRADLARIAQQRFGDMVKGVVDVEQGVMARG
jgi:hypothetical protein